VEASQSNHQDERAYSLAKEALTYISKFRTPPTPDVYEVWYRYVEGENVAIKQQLLHAMNNSESVSARQLQELRKQFLDSSDASAANTKISEQLATEILGLQTLIISQENANQKFGGSIELASARLNHESVTPAEITQCLTSVLQENASIQKQMSEMSTKLTSSKSQMQGLRATLEELHAEVNTDPLTRVGNRRLFDSTISKANQTRTDDPSDYLILVDLDNFKQINDTHGHSTGDDVLRFVASTLKKQAEDTTVTRFGGDEFAVFIRREPDEVRHFSDELCRFFSNNDLTVRTTGEKLGALTISVGAALLRRDDCSESWFVRADRLLYSAKSGGRNRAMVERKNSANATTPSH